MVKSFGFFGGNFLFQRLKFFVNRLSARIIRRFGDERAVIFQRLGVAVLRHQFFAEREPEPDFLLRRGI